MNIQLNIQRIPVITASAASASGCYFSDKDIHSIVTTIFAGTLMFLLSHVIQWAGHKIWKKISKKAS